MPSTTIVLVDLLTPTPKPIDAVANASWLLRAAVAFPERRVLAFGAPGTRKERLFSNIAPADGGRFTIELGAILGELLPLRNGESEAVLSVAGTKAVHGQFCISNAMQVLRYRKGSIDRHALCPGFAVAQFRSDHADEFGGAEAHEDYVASVVTARYVVAGTDADEALSLHIEPSVDDFIAGINRLVAAAILSIDPTKLGILVPVYDRGSFPWVYLLVQGADEALHAQCLSTNLLRTILVGQSLQDDQWALFETLAAGARDIDVPLKAVRTAESYLQAGAYDFALLLATIATEVATARYVRARLLSTGVSRTKLDKVEKDLTFSVMLNTQVTALAPSDRKPDPKLLGEVDALRKARNVLMHEGTHSLDRTRTVALVRAAAAFVDYLASLG